MERKFFIFIVLIFAFSNIAKSQPAAFSLTEPANGIYVSTKPAFTWQTATGSTSYQLWVDGVIKKDAILSTSYTLQTGEELTQGMHTWYVVAINNDGTTQSNETRSIMVDVISPTAFGLLSPENDFWTNNLLPTFEWAASSDSHSGLAKYQLWVDGALKRDNISILETTTTPLIGLKNGNYLWTIKALDNVGNITSASNTNVINVDFLPPGGINNYLICNNNYIKSNSVIEASNEISIEFWMYPTWNDALNNSMRIIGLPRMRIDYNANRVVVRYYNNTYQSKFSSDGSVPLNKWSHIAITHNNSTGVLKIYINGELDSSFTGAYALYSGATDFLYIGKNGTTNWYDYHGKIDEIRIWNKIKTQNEILTTKNFIIEGFDENLKVYYRFNSLMSIDDMSSNNNNSEAYGAVIYNTLSLANTKTDSIIYGLGGLTNLLYPDNQQYISNNIPVFMWEDTIDNGIGLSYYQLFVDNILFADNISNNEYSSSSPLSYGMHTWYISGYDFLGNSQNSPIRTFFIDNASPNPFNLISPTNNEAVMFPTPNLSWEAATDSIGGSGMRKYQLWINGVINRDSIPIGTTTTSPASALPQGEYTWFVRAYDNVGNFRQSTETRTFYVDWEAPTDFALISPSDGATVTAAQPTFEWEQSFDYGSGLSKYELCISGYSPIEISPTETEHSITFDLPNGSYSWFVKAYDNANAFTSSNTHTLTVAVPLPEQAATPVGLTEICSISGSTNYETFGAINASTYNWEITPSEAGILTPTGLSCSIDWNQYYTGEVEITVTGENSVGIGPVSEALLLNLYAPTDTATALGGSFICLGSSTGDLYLTNNNGSVINWQTSSDLMLWTDIESAEIIYSEIPSSTGQYFYRALTQNGACPSVASNYTQVIVADVPGDIGIISGLDEVCQGQSMVSYTVPGIDTVNTYIWTLLSGFNGTSTANEINISFTDLASSGNILVAGENSCGVGQTSELFITVLPLPNSAGLIQGSALFCEGETGVTYTVPEITNATSYVWTLPSGATGTSTSNSITVDFGSSAISGDISVYGTNDCGDGQNSTLSIIVNPLPDEAGLITGAEEVCFEETGVTYTVPEIANVTSYVWTLPSGVTGTSTSNSITVDYGSFAISGDISVYGTNECGDGQISNLAITINQLPDEAGTITGNTTACQGAILQTYTVPEIANATSYVWSLPSGATGTSTTNSIDVDFGTTAISGDISVHGTNDCGDGQNSTLSITVNPLPDAAETISGNTTVCQGATGIMYTVPEIANAISYVWTLPSGTLGTSTTNSITVDFESSATTGDISVYGINDCGNGQSSTLGVIVNEIPQTPTISLSGNILNSDASVGNQWYLNDEIINGAINQDYIAISDGNYYVIVTLLDCSSAPSNIINVIGTDISIVNYESSYNIYPNPVNDELIIEIEGNNEKVNFEILNAIGQVVFNGNLFEKTTVQTSNFASGVYLIKLENGKTFEFKKLIKE